ncbi:hypothetical protein ACA910_000035 [Epithemia clementina (nom. ined.)]
MPSPRVVFKSTRYQDSSPGGSYQSYLSICSSMYSAENNQFHEPIHNPPYGSSPNTQAWTSPIPVPTIVETTTPITTPSPLSQDAIDCVNRANDQLTQEIAELKAQMANLLAQQNQQNQATTPPPPPNISPQPTVDIDFVVKTVLAAL